MTIKQGSPVKTPHGLAEVLSLESKTAGNRSWRVKLCLSGIERWYAEHNLTELVAATATPPAEAALADEIKRACAYYRQAGRVGSVAPMLATQHEHTADKIIEAALRARAVPEGFGLPLSQEPKYTTNASGRIINRATSEPIPDDEPVFIFRAKDSQAWFALCDYIDRLPLQSEHRAAIKRRAGDFADFAANHPERMKEPDTAMLAASKGAV